MSSSYNSQANGATDTEGNKWASSTTPKGKETRLTTPEKLSCPPAPRRPPPRSGHEDSFSPLNLDTKWS